MTGPFIHAYEQIIAQYIEFFLGFALYVDGFATVCGLVAVHAAELAHGDRARNRFASQRHIQNERVEVTAGSGKAAALFDQVLGQCGAVA